MKHFFSEVTWSILLVFLLCQVIIPPSIAVAKGESEKGTIAGIEINEKKKSEIQSLVASEVVKWKGNDIVVQGTTAKIVIPSDYIKFDIPKTVDRYISATSKPWYNFWGGSKRVQTSIEIVLDERTNELLREAPQFLVDETVEAIKEHARYLKAGAVQAEEVELSKDSMTKISFEIQDVVVNAYGISQITNSIGETTLLNREQFSFLQKLEEATGQYDAETANFVASTLYSAVLQSELEITERHSQNVLPDYLVPGVEVKVDKKRNLDFTFVNRTNSPVIISTMLKDGRLLIELYSYMSDDKITYNVTNKEIIEARTIYRLSPNLSIGQERVVEQGKDGMRVRVYKKISNGSFETEELVSRDFYPPKNKVVLVSSLEPPTVTTMPGGESSNPSSDSSASIAQDSNIVNGDNNEDVDNEEDPLSDGSYYDKGGNLITPDSK
jgi:hypothetical protein